MAKGIGNVLHGVQASVLILSSCRPGWQNWEGAS
jgi:hypothetical protein